MVPNYYWIASSAATEQETARKLLALVQLQQEEESMTPYAPEDLNQDWEFKIVRSTKAAFRTPETLSRLTEEEALFGWVMVEKFDDSRVRFKRRRDARSRAAPEGVDPYRTLYEGSSVLHPFVRLVLLFLLLFVFLFVGSLCVRSWT